MDDSDYQFLSSLSPRIKPNKKVKCKGPTLLSVKKHFRRSSIYDKSKATIPNDSLSIIEVSSTDSGSSGNNNNKKEGAVIDEVDSFSCIKETGSERNPTDDDIISPSPPKKEVNIRSLSTGKRGTPKTRKQFDMLSRTKLFEIEKWLQNCTRDYKDNTDTKGEDFSQFSVANYEDFEKITVKEQNNVVNSTMISSLGVVQNLKEDDKCNGQVTDESEDEKSAKDVNKSCEDLLDDLYGNSWRLKSNEVLPNSERKPRRKKITESNNIPKSERISKTYKNPHLYTEKLKSNQLLKALQTKRIKEAIESPFITKLKAFCDDDSEDDTCTKLIPRTKLNFNENQEEVETPPIKSRSHEKEGVPKVYNHVEDKSKCHKYDKFDKENSFSDEIIPLEDRIKKKWSNGSKELPLSEQFNKLNIKQSTNENEGKKKKKTKKLFSDEPNEFFKNDDILDNFDKLLLESEIKKDDECRVPISNSPSPISSRKLKGGKGDNVESKRVTRKKIQNYENSSDSSETSELNFVRNKQISSKETEGKYSFLASLSKNVPDSQCDSSAKIFRNNYKQFRENLLRKLFKLYNEKVFDNALPESMTLEWNDRMRSTAGYCYSRKITRRTGVVERDARIVLSTKVLDSADRLRDTLIHEMCHAGTWIIDQIHNGHGEHWKAWANKARNAFPELPPIQTCHNYQVNTKYVYKCTGCGYSIGRHRKSLDIERKRCGYCLCKFEILINKINKKGEQKTVPATPKKEPNAFALFVKENYSTFKAPGINHAGVMRLLSEKFKEMKV